MTSPSDSQTGPAATAEWLTELISAEAADKRTGEFVIPLPGEDGKLALIVPEELSVYLITVEKANFVAA